MPGRVAAVQAAPPLGPGPAPGLQRACPVCGGTAARSAWRESGERYVRCAACRTLFSDITADYYRGVQHNAWNDDVLPEDTLAFYSPARRPAHERFLAAHPPPAGSRVLDVGCGLGFFVERALAAGYDAYGCDTSLAWVTRAHERIGVDRVVLGDLEDAFGTEARFDLITTWDVLEHVYDPVPFLRAIRERLVPGGRVFIRTPNEAWVVPTNGARRRLLGEEVELGPLNHVVYYRAATLARALGEAGLRPIEWPCLPPPQVGLGNREPIEPARLTLVKRLKNAHAGTARALAAMTRGRIVISSDLDVLAAVDREV